MCLLREVFGKVGGATVFVPGGLVLSVSTYTCIYTQNAQTWLAFLTF